MNNLNIDESEYWCRDCGWWEDKADLQHCPNCDRIACHECRDENGRCGVCQGYDFQKYVKVLHSDDEEKEAADLYIGVLVFWGVGKHYYVSIKDRKYKEIGSKKFNTIDAAKRFIRDAISKFRDKRKIVRIRFDSNEERRYFYREGD